MIEFMNIQKSCNKGKVQAVKSLNLKVERGKIFGFLGPNGAGMADIEFKLHVYI
jgi:ABC-type multidrug transport system ATPase subunit